MALSCAPKTRQLLRRPCERIRNPGTSIDGLRGRNALTAMHAAPEMPGGALLDALPIDASLASRRTILYGPWPCDCWLPLAAGAAVGGKPLSHSLTHRIAPNLVRSALADLAVTMSREGDWNEAARIVR